MADPATPLDAFILAGGQSRRMGRDKARIDFGGATFLETIAETVRPLVATVTLVGRDTPQGRIPAIPDRRPGWGPLAGIETALLNATSPAALVLACDIPLISRDLVGLLIEGWRRKPTAIVIPLDVDGRESPLCGVYPTDARQTASDLLDRGVRMPRVLLDGYPTVRVAFAEYAHLPRAQELLRNINTPDDYAGLPERGHCD